jgi:exodeoxyribonuclease VII large subunit
MTQLPLLEPQSWSVTDLTRYLRVLLENDAQLQDIWVIGEVSNSSRPSSGHMYFTVKDATASLRCVMWRNAVARQDYLPRDGDEIEVHGSINIYEVAGQYQLYVDAIRPVGEGALYQEFLRMKARLEQEGLFDPGRKRPVPQWPRRIGIITSPTGAAIRDMLNTLRRRYPVVEVVLAPTPVQGIEAPPGIVAALEKINRIAAPDVILLARGGGSIEDLWAFNDEQVARAITASNAPVISGVGHETDFTIADFASDLRAATPTAAAELATPNRAELLVSLAELQQRLQRASESTINNRRWELRALQTDLRSLSPQSRLRNDLQRLDELLRRATNAQVHNVQLRRERLSGLLHRLETLNPTAVLGRGYALVSNRDGDLVRSVKQVARGDGLNIHVSDGDFDVSVE